MRDKIKNKKFEIKVSDLLKQPWKKDVVKLEDLFPEKLPQIKIGISGELELQSLNDSELLATLENVYTEIDEICDKCLEPFIRKVECEEYSAKFMMPRDEEETEEEEEEYFPLDAKSEIINIEEMLVQSILLQEPITKKCNTCLEQDKDDNNDEDEYESYFESTGNITFS